MKFPTGSAYRNLRGFARFPGDSTALVIIAGAPLSRPQLLFTLIHWASYIIISVVSDPHCRTRSHTDSAGCIWYSSWSLPV